MSTTKISSIEDQLIRDEKEVLHAYQDSLGFWTIGIGRMIDHRKGGGITQAESLYLLDNDIRKIRDGLLDELPWLDELDEIRFWALVNMAFNLGIPGDRALRLSKQIATGQWV